MDNRLPSRFNPVALARSSTTHQTTLPVSHFKRFASMLLDDSGEVRVRAEFSVQRGGQTVAAGELASQVTLPCQRCMAAMAYNISSQFRFGFVASEEAADSLPDDLDPVLLDEHGELHAVDMVEDELILQLPLTQMHAKGESCQARVTRAGASEERRTPVSGDQQRTHKPFSNLDDLLKN